MSNSSSIARIIAVLALIAVFAVLLYPVGGPTFPFNPVVPVFQNPFDNRIATQTSTFTFLPSYLPSTNLSSFGFGWYQQTIDMTGCTIVWQCVRDDNGTDGAVSYATIHGGFLFATTQGAPCNFASADPPSNCADLLVDLEGSNLAGQKLIAGSVDAWCRSSGLNPAEIRLRNLLVWDGATSNNVVYVDSPPQTVLCSPGVFTHVSWRLTTSGITGNTSSLSHRLTAVLEVIGGGSVTPGPNYLVDVSTVRFTGTYQVTGSACGTDFFSQIGCVAFGFLEVVNHVLLLLLNFVIYAGLWFILATQLLINGLAVIVWLYSVPKMPALFQGLIDVVLTYCLAEVGYGIFKLIRGSPEGI